MKIIDIHTHIMPPQMPNFKSRFGYGGFIHLEYESPCCANMMRDDGKFFRKVHRNCWEPAERLRECDEHGVHVQVLSTIPVLFSYWAKPQDGLVVSQFLNDHLAGVVAENPRRFVGLGTIPLQAPDLAIREMERCVKELGFPGVEIGSHVNDWNLNAPELFPVFEAAASLGAAVFVHPWEMMGSDKMPQYWLPWLVGMPAETSRAICSMIFGGVLERLPTLRLAFAHGGGSFPLTIGRIEHGFNVRPDLCAVDNPINPRAYLDRIYVDSLVHDAEALRFLIKVMGEERIMLGSDYPFPLGEAVPGTLIKEMPDLNPKLRASLLWDNAMRWLNLTDDRFLP